MKFPFFRKMNYEDNLCLRTLDCLLRVPRLLGPATAIVLWGVGFDMVYHKHTFGIFVISTSITLLCLEITWAITLFLRVCLRNESSSLWTCWTIVLWFDSWKKSVMYWTIATILFAKPHKMWLTSLAGGMLLTLGGFYFVRGIRNRFLSKAALLREQDESFDRFDEETESLNGDAANDTSN